MYIKVRVISGKVGRLVNSLMMDIRNVMEPYTAKKLKVSTITIATVCSLIISAAGIKE